MLTLSTHAEFTSQAHVTNPFIMIIHILRGKKNILRFTSGEKKLDEGRHTSTSIVSVQMTDSISAQGSSYSRGSEQ